MPESTWERLVEERKRRFLHRGMLFAGVSGISYGLYTAFLTLAQTQGVWGEWISGSAWGMGNPALSAFTVTFALAALAAAINDLFSGVWSVLVCAKNGQLNDLLMTIRSKPGIVMMACSAIGGPIATIAYVVALNAAAASGNPGVIVPIAALNCAIGTVLGRILFNQGLEAHKVAGVIVCLLASVLVGGTSYASIGPGVFFGCLFALIAAFGWGLEGCVAGFGTTLIDYRVGIAIRQSTAGILELFVAFPIFACIGEGFNEIGAIAGAAFTDPSLVLFLISGLFAMPAFSFWYKGNSMCGTSLGMACNGTYAFWGPLFIWLFMGVFGIGGHSADYPPLKAVQWVGALVMIAGIFLIAVNPAGNLQKEGSRTVARSKDPLTYAIILLFLDGRQRCAQDIISELKPVYLDHKLLTVPDVAEMLATAKENGLLDETGYEASGEELQLLYRINEYGRSMASRYLKR